jgi:hypothetical protein
MLLLLLVVCIGSVCAAEDIQPDLDDGSGGDSVLKLDEGMDEIDNENMDDDLEDSYYGSDDELDDEILTSDDDDEDYEDYDDDEDEDDDGGESYYGLSDFEFLKLKITYYLDRYGNYSSHNWTESAEFKAEYNIYLSNPSNYTLNESMEGHNTYLKIYDSITSTFKYYNLTENETSYLKFMVIFYLNHYGNVSANYTWNESESFANFTLPFYYLKGAFFDSALLSAREGHGTHFGHHYSYYNPFYSPISNSTDGNVTSNANQTSFEAPGSWDWNIVMLIFLIVLMVVIVL